VRLSGYGFCGAGHIDEADQMNATRCDNAWSNLVNDT
jgi:hypothetical protein